MSVEEADLIASRGLKKLELDSDLTHMLLSEIPQNVARKGKISRGIPTLCYVPSMVLIPFLNLHIYPFLPYEGTL